MNARRNPQAHLHTGDLLGCEEAIGYLFRRKGLLRKALTHSSVKDDKHPSNERLEFLGDAILGMVISEYLFSMLPENDEGDLTKVKSVVVSGESLSRLGLEIGLDRFLLIGKGLRLKSEIPRSLIANVVEAIIAAVYLDRGMEAARHFVLDHLHTFVDKVLNDDHTEKNYKSRLQQQAQKTLGQTPAYRVLAERGPDHSKEFRVSAVIGDREFPAGRGACKKDAEQDAAKIALARLVEKRRPARRKPRSGRPASENAKPAPRAQRKPRGSRAATPEAETSKPPAKPAPRARRKPRGPRAATPEAETSKPPSKPAPRARRKPRGPRAATPEANASKKPPAKPAAEGGRKPRKSSGTTASKADGGGASRRKPRGRKPPAPAARPEEGKNAGGNGKASTTRSRRPKAAAKPDRAPARKPKKEGEAGKPRPEAKKRPSRGRRRGGGKTQGSGAN